MEVEEEPSIKTESSDLNPWSVDNASVFLKYCCPECDYKNEELLIFTNHALEKHVNARLLFTPDAILNIKNEYFDEQTDYYSELPLHSELHENDQFDPGLIKKETKDNNYDEKLSYQLEDSYEIDNKETDKVLVSPRSSKLKAMLKQGASENRKHAKTNNAYTSKYRKNNNNYRCKK